MNLIRRIQAASAVIFGASDSFADPQAWMVKHIGGGPSKAGPEVNPWSALAVPTVYAAIGIVSDAVAMLPLVLYRPTANGAEPAKGHPVHRLLRGNPNHEMTGVSFRAALQTHICGWGNGYAEIQRTRGGDPVALWPLLPDRTHPERRHADGEIRYRSTGVRRNIDLPADDVLHVPALSFNGIVGLSPIGQMKEAIGLAIATEKFGAEFFKNEAKSGGFLLHPAKLSKQAKANIVESVEEQAMPGAGKGFGSQSSRRDTGPNSQERESHRIKVLEEGMKYVPTTIPPEDAQFLGTRTFQIEELARAYRVPLVMLQSHEKTSSWGTGIEHIMIGFVVWTIMPWLKRWEEEVNRKLLSDAEIEAGYYVKFNVNALLRGDMKARAEFYMRGIQDGWLTRNEARAFEEFNRLSGLDDPLMPLNFQTVEQAEQAAAQADEDARRADRDGADAIERALEPENTDA